MTIENEDKDKLYASIGRVKEELYNYRLTSSEGFSAISNKVTAINKDIDHIKDRLEEVGLETEQNHKKHNGQFERNRSQIEYHDAVVFGDKDSDGLRMEVRNMKTTMVAQADRMEKSAGKMEEAGKSQTIKIVVGSLVVLMTIIAKDIFLK